MEKSKNLEVQFKEIRKSIVTIESFCLILFCMALISSGSIMNFGVIIHNEGKMPVYSSQNYTTKEYFSFQNFSEVRYPHFADVIRVGSYVMSIGDVIIYFAFLFLIYVLVRHKVIIRKI